MAQPGSGSEVRCVPVPGAPEQLPAAHPALPPQAAGSGLHGDALQRGGTARDGDPQPHGGCGGTGGAHLRVSGGFGTRDGAKAAPVPGGGVSLAASPAPVAAGMRQHAAPVALGPGTAPRDTNTGSARPSRCPPPACCHPPSAAPGAGLCPGLNSAPGSSRSRCGGQRLPGWKMERGKWKGGNGKGVLFWDQHMGIVAPSPRRKASTVSLQEHCHYHGHVRGHGGSWVVLSTYSGIRYGGRNRVWGKG